jgi:hypothetical protein
MPNEHDHLLQEAAEEFYKAQAVRNPPKIHRRKIVNILNKHFAQTHYQDGGRKVSVRACELYALLHQASQLLP